MENWTQLLEERTRSLMAARLQALQARWERRSAELHTLSPHNVLKKGYTLCWAPDGTSLIRKVDEVETGQDLTVSFFQGEFSCRVKHVVVDRLIQDRYKKSRASEKTEGEQG